MVVWVEFFFVSWYLQKRKNKLKYLCDYMKKILIKIIRIYQGLPLRCHDYCKHVPSCSNYMILAIDEYGVIKGIWLGIKRLLRCRPHGTYGYDPVIRKG